MTPLSYINILTIAVALTIALNSCGQSQTKKMDQKVDNKTIQICNSKTAIISFDKKGNYPFDNSFNPTTLTKQDINIIDSLLIVCVTDYNNSFGKVHKERCIDLNKFDYHKQIIAVTNTKGDKEVWVNCFCYTWDNNSWKTKILLVEDGGNCFFNFKINLATKEFYDLDVNGEA